MNDSIGRKAEKDEEFISVSSSANKSLKSMLIEAGYPEKDMFHYGSDLYVYVTPLTTRIFEEWCDIKGYDKSSIMKNEFLFDIFIDKVTGRMMYDIAFQWYE